MTASPGDSRPSRIEALLRVAFAPLHLAVRDDSHLHAGHAGAAAGAGHYSVTIVSAKFRGVAAIGRHRMVYEALRPMLPDEIHALAIEAYAPGERAASPAFTVT